MSIFNELFVTEIHQIFEAWLDKSKKFPMNNRESYGICFAEKGEVVYKHNGRNYVCNNSQAVIIPKGSSYFVECRSTGAFPIINFSSTDSFVFENFLEIPLNNPSMFQNYFYSLQTAYSTRNVLGNAQALSILYKIIGALNREGESHSQSSISNIIEYINQNFSNPNINNELLAQYANLSVSHFRTLFKSTYKTSPMNCVHALRIEKAKQMLINSHYTISQISEACGFTNLYSFSRSFKTNVGISPSEYAKQNRIRII